MSFFKKTEKPQEERGESEVQAELPTILSSLIYRLEQLEHRVDALEETIVGAASLSDRGRVHPIRKTVRKTGPPRERAPRPKAEESAPDVKPVEKTKRAKIVRGKPIRPFKKED